MGKMKANRKFIEGEEAVSAVIGVILMVAITVAIAATVYVYVSGMIGTSPETTPNMQLIKDNVAKKLTVASADPGNLKWSSFEVILNETIQSGTLWTTNFSSINYPADSTAVVTAGQYIQFNSGYWGSITIRHKDTNTLIGTYEFTG